MRQGVRRPVTIVLACIAIGVIIYYSICGGSCSYLKGTMLGIDLTYLGIAYMLAILLVSFLRKERIIFLLVAAGVGVEIFLVGVQVQHDTYCPYCLTFGVIVILLFFVNLDLNRKWLAALSIVIGFAAFLLLFKGQVAPRYSTGYPTPVSPANVVKSTSTDFRPGPDVAEDPPICRPPGLSPSLLNVS